MKTLVIIFSIIVTSIAFASTNTVENKGKCSKVAARAAEKFATIIVYPKGQIEDRAIAHFEEFIESEILGTVAVYNAYMDLTPSAGVSFKVLVDESYGCTVRGIEQTGEE